MEWNLRPGKAVIPRTIYSHVQVWNVGNYPLAGIDYSSDAPRALTCLTRFRREIHMEFPFADDPFFNLMNIFTFHFTANLFPSLWVLSALSWYNQILSCQERSAVFGRMVLLSLRCLYVRYFVLEVVSVCPT